MPQVARALLLRKYIALEMLSEAYQCSFSILSKLVLLRALRGILARLERPCLSPVSPSSQSRLPNGRSLLELRFARMRRPRTYRPKKDDIVLRRTDKGRWWLAEPQLATHPNAQAFRGSAAPLYATRMKLRDSQSTSGYSLTGQSGYRNNSLVIFSMYFIAKKEERSATSSRGRRRPRGILHL